jgi:HD-GYP domain-containing protein (c-di-GMP phosphodiesterase class II)
VARYGGEEFAIICPETDVDQALMLADRLRVTMAQQVRFPAHPQLVVRASFGVVSSADARVGSVNDLINLGDQALYCSKRTGRDRVTRADAMSEAAAEPDCHLDEVDRLRKEVHALSVRGKELCLRSVWALIQALEARDGYSAWHSRNVTFYTKWLAEAAGWPRPMRNAIANAAMLHDLGKIGVPDEMLFKPQPLTAEEAAILRQVPQLTCRILEPLRLFETEIEVIRHLRERFDGMGYPDGLHGESIPIGSRMLAITEAFDSITCDRAYRQGRSLEEALDVMAEESGKQFDPKFVDLLTTTVHAQRKRWQNRIDQARVEASCEVNGAAAAAGAV